MSTATQIVEHIVLFKVKPDTHPSKVSAMVNGLSSLISLHQVLSLTAGPIHRFHSSSSSLTFTHLLHIRFRSKPDLHSYSAHPSHVTVVNESRSIIDDIMAVDWFANEQQAPAPGSAMRITFFKIKDGKIKMLKDLIGGNMRDRFPSSISISFGENFSPDRSKGFSIGSILNFHSLGELEAQKSNGDQLDEKVGELIDGTVVIDYVIPATAATGCR